MEINVRSNDSLWYYSRLFDVPLTLIEKSNPQMEAHQLVVGESVQIPGYMLQEYTVDKNDTLWKIAMLHNLPLDSLQLVNPSVNTTALKVGGMIYLPQRINELVISYRNQYTYEKMQDDLRRLLEIYPFIVSQTIGHSVMGKELIELQIGTGTKQVHLNGSFHANEWITTPVIMQFINEYALSLTNEKPIRGLFMLPLFMSTMFSVVPMVNPDGVNLSLNGSDAAAQYKSEVLAINNQSEDFSNWKANIRGVDLNNQYPAKWEIEAQRMATSPAPRDYPGPYPLSEPEAIIMANLAKQRNFSRINAFHTQGEEIYWGFEGIEPPVSEIIVNEYARVSGYLPVRYLDSYAGYKDWFIQEFHKPGFTVELGQGVNPLPIEQFPDIYEKNLGIMLANLYL